MTRYEQWFRKWVSDGLWTHGEQIGCQPGQARMFTRCVQCGRIFPHWWASMTAEEAKARGRIGCACGSLRIAPTIIPGWQSAWWFVIRGWLIRKVLLKKRLWDPRMVVMEADPR